MVVNFRARGISRGARKLARTPTLNSKKKITCETFVFGTCYLSSTCNSYKRLDVQTTSVVSLSSMPPACSQHFHGHKIRSAACSVNKRH
jgi:hypothetical protein